MACRSCGRAHRIASRRAAAVRSDPARGTGVSISWGSRVSRRTWVRLALQPGVAAVGRPPCQHVALVTPTGLASPGAGSAARRQVPEPLRCRERPMAGGAQDWEPAQAPQRGEMGEMGRWFGAPTPYGGHSRPGRTEKSKPFPTFPVLIHPHLHLPPLPPLWTVKHMTRNGGQGDRRPPPPALGGGAARPGRRANRRRGVEGPGTA